MIIDCHGHYTTAPEPLNAWRKQQTDALKAPTDPKNRAQITRILTYHILPGVILSDDGVDSFP